MKTRIVSARLIPSHHPSAVVAEPRGGAARIGPNSVLQTHRALVEMEGAPRADAVLAEAGIPWPLPDGMIPDAWFVSLVSALRTTLPWDRSEAVLGRAGHYTAQYVLANRIPGPFRALLRRLPASWATPLLLEGIRRHAWTFAGRGRFESRRGRPREIWLEDAPTCGPCFSGDAFGPEPFGSGAGQGGDPGLEGGGDRRGGRYYQAAFEGLIRGLADGRARVVETECALAGAPRCRFEIRN